MGKIMPTTLLLAPPPSRILRPAHGPARKLEEAKLRTKQNPIEFHSDLFKKSHLESMYVPGLIINNETFEHFQLQ